jgi:hypothetical protein
MVNKQPLIRGHIWLIALGLVNAFYPLRVMLLAGAGGVTKLSLQNGTYDPSHGIATGSALLISIVTALPMIPIYGGAARPSTDPSRERRGSSFWTGWRRRKAA